MLSNNQNYQLDDNDKYYKYKFREALNAKMGVIVESLSMEKQVKLYHSSVDYARRLHNISFQLVSLEYQDMTYFDDDNEVLPGIDIVMMPTNYDMLRISNASRWIYTGIVDSSDTYIISAKPELKLVSNLNLFNTDTETLILLVTSILLVSVALSLNTINNLQPSLNTRCLCYYVKTFFRRVWDIVSLIFFEPLNGISNWWSERILLTTWLIGLTFFYCVLSCYLKSEFFQEEYLVLDNVDQLIEQKRLKTRVMEKGYEYFYLLEILGAKDESVKKWLKDVDLFVGFDMFSWDFYLQLCEGAALISSDLFLKYAFGALMEWGETDEIESILKKGGLYVSRSILRSEQLYIPVDGRLFENNPVFREYYSQGMMVFFECKPFYNMDLYNKYPLDIVSWSTPIKTLSPIDLFALTAPFYIIPIGYSMTLLALLFEYLIGKKEAQLGRSELGSDNRINVLEENSKDVDVSENEHEAPNPLDDDLDNDLAENGHEAPTSIDVDLDKYVAPIEEEPFA